MIAAALFAITFQAAGVWAACRMVRPEAGTGPLPLSARVPREFVSGEWEQVP